MLREFKSFPLAARRLIIYYTLSSPFLVVDVIFPVYLFRLGFNVEIAGFLYAISALMGVVFTFLIGRALDRVLSVKTAMSIIEVTFASANFVYAYATSPIHIVLGSFLERIGRVFTVSYQVYERDAYPEEIREKIYVYHMALPEAAQLFTFPLIGILLGFFFTSLEAFRTLFIISATSSIFFLIYIQKWLPETSQTIRLKEERKLINIPKQILPVAAAEVFIVFSFGLTCGLVLDNYVFNVLSLSVFFIILIEVAISGTSILASFTADKAGKKSRFKMLYTGIILMTIYAIFTANIEYWGLNPIQTFALLFVATVVMEFGHTIWLIFHRSYLFHFIPSEKRGSILGSISSMHRIFAIIAPLIAGIMAYRITPLSPFYLQFSLLLFAIVLYRISTPKSNETKTSLE